MGMGGDDARFEWGIFFEGLDDVWWAGFFEEVLQHRLRGGIEYALAWAVGEIEYALAWAVGEIEDALALAVGRGGWMYGCNLR